jgi:hypothetical protein
MINPNRYLPSIRRILIFIFIGCTLLLMVKCSKKVDTQQQPPPTDTSQARLSTDSSILHISSKPYSADSFYISSNVNWTITYSGNAASWIRVSDSAGSNNKKIIVTTLTANLNDTPRHGSITISRPNGTTPITINLSQLGLRTEFPARNVYGGDGSSLLFGYVPSADGGFVAIGSSSGNAGDAQGNHGSNDMWVIKVDASGKLVWQRQFGGSSDDGGYCIANAQDGGFLAVGYAGSNNFDVIGNHGGMDIFVVKMDANGNKLWTKCYGGSGDEQGISVVATNDGGYIITGGATNMNLLKIDGSGNLVWQKFTSGYIPRNGFWITQGIGNGYIAVGTSTYSGSPFGVPKIIDTGYGGMDIWMGKIDENGNLLWNKEFGGSKDDIPFFVEATPDGGYLISGYTNSTDGMITKHAGGNDFWVIKTDSSGNLQWQKSFGGSADDAAYASANSYEGGYVIGGVTQSIDGDVTNNHGGSDGWVITLDAAGNLISQKTIGGSSSDIIFYIRPIGSQKYMLAGESQSYNGDILGATGYNDGWLMKF